MMNTRLDSAVFVAFSPVLPFREERNFIPFS